MDNLLSIVFPVEGIREERRRIEYIEALMELIIVDQDIGRETFWY